MTEAIPLDQLRSLVRPVGALTDARRLEGGWFATTYAVTLDDGTRVVVKCAPGPEKALLTHERDLLRAEALVYRLCAQHDETHDDGLFMPRVLHTDFTRAVVPVDVVVASFLPGVPWVDAGFGTPADDERAARAQRDLGALIGRLGHVTGEAFGYPLSPALQAPAWADAFALMVEALLADAVTWGVDVPAARVRSALATHRAALDEVHVPRLVHTDLWPGNLFVDEAGALVGVIDPERAVFGDPLMDLAGADPMWRGLDKRLVGGLDVRSSGARTRLALYRLWLALVMVIEVVPRRYEGDWLADHDHGNRTRVERALAELGA